MVGSARLAGSAVKPGLEPTGAVAKPAPELFGLVPGRVLRWEAVGGGANNRAWRVTGDEGIFFLKEYYRGDPAGRDRGASEEAFYRVATERTPGYVPEALAWASGHRAGLFRWLEGRKLSAGEIREGHLDQAFDFFARLNRAPLPITGALPNAAETAVSVKGHLEIVEGRVRRLAELSGDAGDFVRGEVLPRWENIRRQAAPHGGMMAEPCLSPSDFGFHNALVDAKGGLKFFDFEYAGWDDPAKMAADFVCQPRIPSPEGTRERLAALLAGLFPGDPTVVRRFEVLEPVYRVKWVCIILNSYLSDKQKIHSFAEKRDKPCFDQIQKLAEARAYFSKLNN